MKVSFTSRGDYILHLGLVAVWSFAILCFEILGSKILMFFQVYGHPLVIVAVAMLGMGLGGLLAFSRGGYSENWLWVCLLFQSPCLILGMVIPGLWNNSWAVILGLALSFFFYSLLLGIHFARYSSYLVYFANLFGSGLGISAVYFLLPVLGGETLVLILALLVSVLGWIYLLVRAKKRWLVAQSLVVIFSLGSLVLQLGKNRFDLLKFPVSRELKTQSPLEIAGKACRLKSAQLLATRWNLVARVDVIWTPGHPVRELFFPQGISEEAHPSLIKEARLSFNSEIHFYANNTFFSSVAPSAELYTESLPYSLLSRPRVLIIGPGGGGDIARARYKKAREIVAVEINPTVVQLMKNELYSLSDRVYEGVEIYQMDGRTYLESSSKQFDLINLVFADLYIPFYKSNIFMENYLYTLEAFIQYLSHLTPQGILSITKMLGTITTPTELLRIVATLLEGFKELGISEPESHIVVLGFGSEQASQYAGMVLAKKHPFSESELRLVRSYLRPPVFPLYLPGESRATNPFQKLILSPHPEKFYQTYPLQIFPTTDQRPFFYLFDKNLSLHKEMLRTFLLLTLILFLLPAGILLKQKGLAFHPVQLWFSGYFALLGFGYMFLQSVLVQRFNLYLGGALYSLSLVVGALLVFGGLGSLLAGKLSLKVQLVLLLLLSLGVLGYLPPFTGLEQIFPLNLGARALVSLALLFPISLLVGIPFPLGLKLARESLGKGTEPYFFGLNAIFCTLAVIISLYISARFGLKSLFLGSAGAYLLAMIILLRLIKRN